MRTASAYQNTWKIIARTATLKEQVSQSILGKNLGNNYEWSGMFYARLPLLGRISAISKAPVILNVPWSAIALGDISCTGGNSAGLQLQVLRHIPTTLYITSLLVPVKPDILVTLVPPLQYSSLIIYPSDYCRYSLSRIITYIHFSGTHSLSGCLLSGIGRSFFGVFTKISWLFSLWVANFYNSNEDIRMDI